MAWKPAMRMSDDDRDRIVGELREHAAAGRLSMDEFEERMAAVYRAPTFGEVEPLLHDLPVDLDLLAAPMPSPMPAAAGPLADVPPAWAGPLRRWSGLAVMLTGLWALFSVTSGHLDPFWPAWPLGIVGLVTLVRAVKGEDPDHQAERTARYEERAERHQLRAQRHQLRAERQQMRAEYERMRHQARIDVLWRISGQSQRARVRPRSRG